MQTMLSQELATLEGAIAHKRNGLITVGILMVIVGTIAIAFPHVSSLSIGFTIGLLMAVAGIASAIGSFSYPKWQGMVLNLIISGLWVMLGCYLLVRPLDGLFALTMLVAVGFIIEGVLKIIFAFQLRQLAGWGWALFSGIVAAALGLMLMAQFPSSALWALGTLAGINILISGWSLIMLAMTASKLIRKASTIET